MDFGDGCVGGEAFRADTEAVDVGGELGVSISLGGRARAGWGGGGARVVDGVGLEVEFLDAALGEHADAAAY